MKTLNEMRMLTETKQANTLTVDIAKSLIGKKIQTIYYGYHHQDDTQEFVVGAIMSEYDYYRQLKEDCYPDAKGHRNRAEYWESYMTKEQLDRVKRRMLVITADGHNTNIFYDPKCDFDGSKTFCCSDIDRYVFFIEVKPIEVKVLRNEGQGYNLVKTTTLEEIGSKRTHNAIVRLYNRYKSTEYGHTSATINEIVEKAKNWEGCWKKADQICIIDNSIGYQYQIELEG